MVLATPEVVGTLEALDLLNLDDPGPWPGEPEGESAWTVDWKSVEASNQPEQLDEWDEDVGANQTYRTERSWGPVRDELLSEAGKDVHVPPPDVLDALAWYLPIHNFGYGWGGRCRQAHLEVQA